MTIVQNGSYLQAERTIGASIVDRVKERLIVPRNCETPEQRAQVVAGLSAVMNHQVALGFIVWQTRLSAVEVDDVVERWTKEVMHTRAYPINLKAKFKRFLIEKAITVGKVKRAR